jgi:hypothetical protein
MWTFSLVLACRTHARRLVLPFSYTLYKVERHGRGHGQDLEGSVHHLNKVPPQHSSGRTEDFMTILSQDSRAWNLAPLEFETRDSETLVGMQEIIHNIWGER